MKKQIQSGLQKALGFDRYLFWFSRANIATIPRRRQYANLVHFLDQLSPDDNVLDIGANIGIMTVLIARRVPRGQVVAFEPISENFAALRRVCDHYRLPNVTLEQLALGDEDGELTMVMPEHSNVRMQGLSHAVSPDGSDDVPGQHYSVPVRRLDDLRSTLPGRIAAIKIDVENFELFVFRGGVELLQADRPLVFAELWNSERSAELVELFRGLGYTLQAYRDGALAPVPDTRDSGDYFLVPPRSGDATTPTPG